ncbi:hypothetical protein LSH36_603g00004 [Paralvinella palmiformis]|uniref:G-protein coupled receptors family 1 profile domain-containing protein n=1 Tax=Paralvinella palmiformis TaxID=53620 RepID=A0AAD9MUQ9_9ANNE|nr:hypothetical protein LSH36_603g00004 [Paralvinella palmiformis]
MDVLMCTASIWHMCTMSMDRYFTLKYPMKYGRNKTKMMVVLKIAFVWIISIAICSPLCIMGFIDYNNVYDAELLLCAPNIPNFVIYGSVFAFYVPLFIMVVTYLLTTRILRSNQKLMGNMIQEQEAYRKSGQQNGGLLGNGLARGTNGMATISLPIRKTTIRSRETSISERASMHESVDFLERRSGSSDSPRSAMGDKSALPPEEMAIPKVEEPGREPVHLESAYQPLSPLDGVGHFGFCAGQIHATLGNQAALSVSQPHLPSMREDKHARGEHRLLAPSKSHNSLNTRQQQQQQQQQQYRSQLSVSHLESVKNFDSIISLNSMLSQNWGSEAWSDFDDPAMFEKLSQIEAEMDECLDDEIEANSPTANTPTTSTTNDPGRIGSGDTESSRDPYGVANVDSTPGSGNVFSPDDSTKGVFLYPDTTSLSPDNDIGSSFQQRCAHEEKVQTRRLGSTPSVSITPLYCQSSTSGSNSLCTSPLSPTMIPTNASLGDGQCLSTAINRPSSPAIMIEDTSRKTNLHSDELSQRNAGIDHSEYITRANSCREKTRKRTMTPSHSTLSDNTSSNYQPSSSDGPSRTRLQLDLDTLVLTVLPDYNPPPGICGTVAPIITTSPASTRSQSSPPNGSASPISSRPSFSTCQLNSPSSAGSPWEHRICSGTDALSVTAADDYAGLNCRLMAPAVGNPGKLSAGNNGGSSKSDATSLSPCGSLCPQSCQSPSLVDTELISQEVERSTDDTLSDQQSFSTSSASRYHIPSLAVHWSGKEHGIHLGTFLRQVSFRRSTYDGLGFAKKKRMISKRRATNEKKASKVLGIIFAVFVVLWSPFFVVNIMTATCIQCRHAITPPVVTSLVWLGYLSSLANPIIYTMFNTSFRRAFINIITCRLRHQRMTREGTRGNNRKKAKQNLGTSTYYSTYISERRTNQ